MVFLTIYSNDSVSTIENRPMKLKVLLQNMCYEYKVK